MEEKQVKMIKKYQATKKEKKGHGNILPKTRRLLEEFYEPYNKQLGDFLKDDRFLWR